MYVLMVYTDYNGVNFFQSDSLHILNKEFQREFLEAQLPLEELMAADNYYCLAQIIDGELVVVNSAECHAVPMITI